jgi:hypothetical protein
MTRILITDISEKGVGFYSKEEYMPGERDTLPLSSPRRRSPVCVDVTVVRCEQNYDFFPDFSYYVGAEFDTLLRKDVLRDMIV